MTASTRKGVVEQGRRDNALRRKPVADVGASTGLFGAVRARAELRKVLAAADVLRQSRSEPATGSRAGSVRA